MSRKPSFNDTSEPTLDFSLHKYPIDVQSAMCVSISPPICREERRFMQLKCFDAEMGINSSQREEVRPQQQQREMKKSIDMYVSKSSSTGCANVVYRPRNTILFNRKHALPSASFSPQNPKTTTINIASYLGGPARPDPRAPPIQLTHKSEKAKNTHANRS